MVTSHPIRKEFKIYSIESSNSGTPDSYHLRSVGYPEKFKNHADALTWIENEEETADYIILEIFSK